MRGFFHTIVFFTRFPLPRILYQWLKSSQQKNFVYFFSTIGLFIGSFQFFCTWVFSFFFSLPIAIALGLLLTIFFSGALHEDGLADFFDGFASSANRETILQRMQDSHLGVYGTSSLIFSILLRFLLLEENLFLDKTKWQSEWFFLFIFLHMQSKGFLLVAMKLPYARSPHSKSFSMVQKIKAKVFLANLILPVFFLFLLYHKGYFYIFAIALTISFFFAFAFTIFLSKRLRGFSGDTLGALEQMLQVLFLLVLAFFK